MSPIKRNPVRKARNCSRKCSCCSDKENHHQAKHKIVPVTKQCKVKPPIDGFYKMLERYPDTIPDVRKWSVKNVAAFLMFLKFAEEARVFEEKEIDGPYLLLMKRKDVLTGLGFKLGPALKIYKHVLRLQTRRIA